MKIRTFAALLVALLTAFPAFGIECRSVAGHLNGQRATMERHAALKGTTLFSPEPSTVSPRQPGHCHAWPWRRECFANVNSAQ